jgi:hypothetical protein
MIRRIHKNFIQRRFPLALASVLFFAIRIPWVDQDLHILWSVAIIQTGVALSLLYLAQVQRIIRQRTLLPAFFYLLLTGANPALFYDLRGSISAFLTVLCLASLFNAYLTPGSQRNALNIAVILTAGSFYWPPLLFLFPPMWYGMIRFKSLNIKTFLANLIGILLVCLLGAAWCVGKNDWTPFTQLLADWSALGEFQLFSLNMKRGAMILFLLFLFILSGVNIFMAGISEKVRTISLLSYLYLLTAFLFLFFLIQNQWDGEWLSIVYIPLSLLIAHYFTFSKKTWESWLFLLTIVFFLLTAVWYWILTVN